MDNLKEIEANLYKITGTNYVVDTFQAVHKENQKLKQEIEERNNTILNLQNENKNWVKLFKLQNSQLKELETQLKTEGEK